MSYPRSRRAGNDTFAFSDDVGDRALNTLGVCERGKGGGKCEGVDAEGHEEGLNRADDLGIADRVADAHASQGVCLGEGPHDNNVGVGLG